MDEKKSCAWKVHIVTNLPMGETQLSRLVNNAVFMAGLDLVHLKLEEADEPKRTQDITATIDRHSSDGDRVTILFSESGSCLVWHDSYDRESVTNAKGEIDLEWIISDQIAKGYK